METKGICLCKQETHVEDSSRTIVRMIGIRATSSGRVYSADNQLRYAYNVNELDVARAEGR